jgi:hypothetical protein
MKSNAIHSRDPERLHHLNLGDAPVGQTEQVHRAGRQTKCPDQTLPALNSALAKPTKSWTF